MFTVQLIGADELVIKLERPASSGWPALYATIAALTIKLQALVIQKLSGDLLQVRSGDLRRSIQQEVIRDGSSILGRVFSSGDVKYARIQEEGGTTSPHDIVPSKAKALHFFTGGSEVFATVVHHPGSRIRGKHYLSGSLAEMQGGITMELKRAVIRDYQEALDHAA